MTRVSNAVAAGTTTVNSSSVDMKGFDAVAFVVAFGAITSTAVTSCKLQGSTDDSTFVDLESTGVTVADTDDNKIFVLEQDRPRYRYLRCTVVRGTANAVIDGIVAHQLKPQVEPVTQPSSTTTSEYNHASAAGTA